ncbi:MAG: hypothetical protein JXR70_18495 [Spirochaetales bacterium]|nr:hypothetical protein [Spirochaetales bacterium]
MIRAISIYEGTKVIIRPLNPTPIPCQCKQAEFSHFSGDEVLMDEQRNYFIIMDSDKEINIHYTAIIYYTDTPDPERTSSPDKRGDVNRDFSVNIVDALLVAQYYVGLPVSNFYKENGDANCDSIINIVDALVIAQFYVSLITRLC